MLCRRAERLRRHRLRLSSTSPLSRAPSPASPRRRGQQLDSAAVAPHPLSLAAVLRSLCRRGRSDEAHRRFLLFLSPSSSSSSSPLLPSHLDSLFSALLSARTPLLTLRLLRRLPHGYPRPSLRLNNRLLHLLAVSHHPSFAHRFLFQMLAGCSSFNAVSFTCVIHGYATCGDLASARMVFDDMLLYGVAPNSLTRSMVVKAAIRARDLDDVEQTMQELWQVLQQDEEDSSDVKNAAFANVVGSLCRDGLFHLVFRIAEEMPQKGSVDEGFAYAELIDSLSRVGHYHGASRVVYIMRKRGLLPSLVSYNCIVHGLSVRHGCMRAYQLVLEGACFGYCPAEATFKVLVEALCKEKDVLKAKHVMELMLLHGKKDSGDNEESDTRATRIYNILLNALRYVENPSEQLDVLVSMVQRELQPDVITLNTIVHGFCRVGRVNEARKILNDMMNNKFCAPDVVTFTTFITGLLDAGESGEALHVLRVVMSSWHCSPNVVTYNAVLKGLFNLNDTVKAMAIFAEMKSNGIGSDCSTHTTIVEGLCHTWQLEKAKAFWDEVIWPSKIHDDFVYAAILKGLCHVGKLDEACDFLYELVDCGVSPNIVSYNILIDSACKLGRRKEAYRIVNEMKRNGLEPDTVTWRILGRVDKNEPYVLDEVSRSLFTSNDSAPVLDNVDGTSKAMSCDIVGESTVRGIENTSDNPIDKDSSPKLVLENVYVCEEPMNPKDNQASGQSENYEPLFNLSEGNIGFLYDR